jgi:putative phosphoribosyl transferase
MSFQPPFADRRAAGRAMARILASRELAKPVVLALPRGGVPVAAEIARAVAAPLDLVLVRKIGVPFQRELAVAAVVDGSKPEVVVNQDVAASAGIDQDYIDALVTQELKEIERRRKVYLQGRTRVPVEGRTVILVDDGIATGASIEAALRALKRKNVRALILAVPVAPSETIEELKSMVDEIVCLRTPEPFVAIGVHYVDFHQMSDAEISEILAECGGEIQPVSSETPGESRSRVR